jgi:hypothetical protein
MKSSCCLYICLCVFVPPVIIFVFCVFRAVWKESRQFVLPRAPCYDLLNGALSGSDCTVSNAVVIRDTMETWTG